MIQQGLLIVHDLSAPGAPGSGPDLPWRLLSDLVADGGRWTVIHTRHEPLEVRRDLQAACLRAGARYEHIEDRPLPLEAPIHPPIEAQRIGWHLIHVLRQLEPEVVVFAGSPAHAAAPLAARRAGIALARCAVVLAADDLRERTRERLDAFPGSGREDIATDFLERTALAEADAAVFQDSSALTWARSRGWSVPDRSGPADALHDLIALAGDAAVSAAGGDPALPSVAVCMPHFEQPRKLLLALEDIAAQTLAPDEVIVIDDGSRSDEARAAFNEASRRFALPGWQFLRQDNAGPAAARNRAASVARADALLFCDSDNRYRPDMVASLARAMARTGAAAVTCAFHALTEGADPSRDPGYIFLPLGSCLESAMVENTIADTNTLVKRGVFHEVGGFPGGSLVEDWRCYLAILERGLRIEVVPDALFTYVISATSRLRTKGELSEASAAIERFLEGAHPVWSRLWPYAAGAIRNPRLHELEAALADSRIRAELATREAAREARLSWARELLTDEERRRALEREQRALDRLEAREAPERERLRALGEKQVRLRRELEQASAALALRDEKIRRMQRSFSWKATAPLRALRRALLDPLGAPKVSPAASHAETTPGPDREAPPADSTCYHYFIEAPRDFRHRGESFTIRGWCFYEDIAEPTAIRARVGERTYDGVHGLGRPDIALLMPGWKQAARSGFRIEVALEAGDHRLDLELRDATGAWRRFVDFDLDAEPPAAPKGSYDHWVATYDTLSDVHLAAFRARAARLQGGPLLSILMPVFNTDPRWLARAIASVRAQAYENWELCITDDASTDPRLRPLLERAAAEDHRIRLTFRESNGHICEATNTALGMASGDFCALFDHDDELRPHSLLLVAEELAAHPDAEFIYSDEDKIDELGRRFDPHFKPDWNPDLLRSQNYLCHLAVIRTSTLRSLGGMRPGFEGSQDWDLFLRLSERVAASSIRHIPRVLYHWRAVSGSTALDLVEKDYASEAARRALAGHCERIGLRATLVQTVGRHWRLRVELPPARPLVSIIIPTHNAARLVAQCVASLVARTDYEPCEILLVDNRSDDPEALALFEQLERRAGVRVLRYDQPFNYSAINNFAVRESRGEVVCLLNNDIEVLEGGWLAEMTAHALRPDIGAVGARLLYPDRRLQHAGVIVGLGGVAGHAFKLFSRDEPGNPQFRPHLTQNLSAVTAACLVIRRSVYEEVGGLDEQALPVAFNDVDFCLRIQARGYRNLYTPFAEMIHHESATRGSDDTPEKVERFRREIEAIQARWGDSLLADPAYNPNLSLDSEDFALAYPPRLPDLAQPRGA
ncbi:putative glycosyltransferase EpsE [mine drainage metagenome]|uniref:Putative glycosyltransferase EpsE n=1 Tax=mine drainage metagenome TaxID=410659 RepID=A0A1J5S5Q8_9ZZZZ